MGHILASKEGLLGISETAQWSWKKENICWDVGAGNILQGRNCYPGICWFLLVVHILFWHIFSLKRRRNIIVFCLFVLFAVTVDSFRKQAIWELVCLIYIFYFFLTVITANVLFFIVHSCLQCCERKLLGIFICSVTFSCTGTLAGTFLLLLYCSIIGSLLQTFMYHLEF